MCGSLSTAHLVWHWPPTAGCRSIPAVPCATPGPLPLRGDAPSRGRSAVAQRPHLFGLCSLFCFFLAELAIRFRFFCCCLGHMESPRKPWASPRAKGHNTCGMWWWTSPDAPPPCRIAFVRSRPIAASHPRLVGCPFPRPAEWTPHPVAALVWLHSARTCVFNVSLKCFMPPSVMERAQLFTKPGYRMRGVGCLIGRGAGLAIIWPVHNLCHKFVCPRSSPRV